MLILILIFLFFSKVYVIVANRSHRHFLQLTILRGRQAGKDRVYFHKASKGRSKYRGRHILYCMPSWHKRLGQFLLCLNFSITNIGPFEALTLSHQLSLTTTPHAAHEHCTTHHAACRARALRHTPRHMQHIGIRPELAHHFDQFTFIGLAEGKTHKNQVKAVC